jgi:hypothetical protein
VDVAWIRRELSTQPGDRVLRRDADSDEEQQPEPFDLEAVNRRLTALRE